MTSFYSRTPSGFMVEYGWGGRCIDPASWQPGEMTNGGSLWGHERLWLDAERRQSARDIQLQVAAARVATAGAGIGGQLRRFGWCVPLVGSGQEEQRSKEHLVRS